MKKYLFIFLSLMLSLAAMAQQQAPQDSTTFKGYFFNKQYNIYLRLDLYNSSVVVPGQDIFGKIPGYLGDKQDGRKWLVVESEISRPGTAALTIINDYGSEDLTATLTQQNDSTIVLKQEQGSDIKIARNRKWVKLPKTIEFVRR